MSAEREEHPAEDTETLVEMLDRYRAEDAALNRLEAGTSEHAAQLMQEATLARKIRDWVAGDRQAPATSPQAPRTNW